MVTKQDIINGLRELGLRAGDTVVVHSSLSSFGEVDGGAEAVVDVLLEVLGSEGTLVAPTFNFNPGVFDPAQTPSVVGEITEAVRKRPNAVRSLHPTHSVAAIGRLAEAIIDGHEKTHPFGRGSALFNVLQANGTVLQLGTDQATNSMAHVAEEIAGSPYLERSRQVGIKTPRGAVVRKWVRRPGCGRGFAALEEPLQERGAISQVMIGDCKARLMSARAVVEAALEILRLDPEGLLCRKPDCPTCAEARAIVAATQTEKQEKEITELAEEEERTRRMIENRLEGGVVAFFEHSEEDTSPN